MLASDEASASVTEVGGGALRRLRLSEILVLVSDGLLDLQSSPSSRLERRRRLVTLTGRLSSEVGVGILVFAIALVVVLVSACCGLDPFASCRALRSGVDTAQAFGVDVLCWVGLCFGFPLPASLGLLLLARNEVARDGMVLGGGGVAGAEISVASEVEVLPSCVLFNRLVAGLLLSYWEVLSMLASDETSASVTEVGGGALRRLRLADVAVQLLSVVQFNRLVAGLSLSRCCALSMIASDDASASVREVGDEVVRRLRLFDMAGQLLSPVLFSRLVARLPLS